jgi:predicted lysophospholipase L1 biosynthesis ABC-type transport system permease subunit
VSAVVTTALVLAVLHAILVAYVTVVAVRTDDRDRQKTAVAVLEILALSRRWLRRSERDA